MTHSAYTGVTSRQWQQSINGGAWTDISGATGTTCNTGTLTNSSSSDITQKYRVKVNGTVYSAEALITVSGDDPPASGNFSLVTNYNYDRAGRLTSVTQNIGTGDVTVAENEYNELGQLIKTKLHKKADNSWLETVNYAYNIRGWTTKIDAGYFKEELHYHDAVTGISNTPQWAGNISAMEWNARNVDNKWHAYAFTYDTLSRLKAGVYRLGAAQGTGYGSTGNNLYNEDYTYDVMGNMKSMNRWLDGEYIDQLTFTQDGNMTSHITDAKTSVGFAGTSDYTYDAVGRLKTDSQKGITKVDYNHMSLPQFVIKGTDSLKYTYDAVGRRVKRQFKTETARYYIDGAEYESNKLKFVSTPYGRIRKEGSTWHYDYYLKDHLGNVRAVLTSDPNNQEVYTASMEVGASPNPSQGGETAAYESLYFANLDQTRADKPYNYPDYNPLNQKVAKVPGKSRGPSITLKVMAGDTIEISAKAFYNIDNTLPGQGVDIVPIVGSAIAAMTSPVGAVLDEAAQLALDLGAEASQSVALVGLPKDDRDNYQNPQPKSGINFVAYNDKFKVIPENTGVIMVQDNINTIQTLATDKIIIQESGFLEVYANNEAQTPVYFDNLTVSRRAGAALEVNAYYPFGMLNPGLSNTNGDAPNAYKYNAKELQDMENFKTGWLDYGARMLEPAVGRWWCPDPLAENHFNMSPYAFAGNDPILFIDPNGEDYWSTNDPKEIERLLNMLKYESRRDGGSIETYNFGSWNHATDEEFLGKQNEDGSYDKLTYNDQTRTFYTSYGTIEDGEVVIHGVSIKAVSTLVDFEGIATVNTKHQIYDPPGLENVYTFERILFPAINIVTNPEKVLDRMGFAKGSTKNERKINPKRSDRLQSMLDELKRKKDQAVTNVEKDEIQRQIDHIRLKLRKSEPHGRGSGRR